MNQKQLEFQEKLGKHLRKMREEKGVSLRELEFREDLDRGYLSRIENGQSNPSAYTLQIIADALGISLGELLKDFS